MNEMTRQDLEERLLDYLYDELDASERAAFEQALPRHPEVEREVVSHRATRRAYQALPRDAAPAGLLDGVLAEADKEAASRVKSEPAAAPVGPGLWERLRRLVFQPAFAMAMVALVVAGVSLVATRKGDLPGTGPSTDAQHLPPVAVTESAAPVAPVGAAAAPRGTDEEAAPEPAAAASKLDLAAEGADRKNEAVRGDGDLAEPADGLVESRLEAPVVADPGKLGTRSDAKAKAPRAAGEAVWGADVAGQGGFGAPPADVPAPPPAKELLAKGDNGVEEDQRPAEVVDAVRAKDSTAGGGVPAEPTRTAPAKPATEPLRDASLDNGGGEKTPGPVPAARPAAPAPPTVTKVPTGRPDSDDKKVADEREESGDRDVSTTEQPKREVERVATTESARTPSPDIDDEGKSTPTKTTPTLTPPASPERLWSTYQQQLAAGAWADAQRSIEALAKLEGESARVKQARAELKKKLEAGGKTNTGADKIPPDPPVQPPK